MVSDTKFLKRKKLFVEAGELTASLFRRIMHEECKVPKDIIILSFNKNSTHLDDAVNSYFSCVDQFKSDNEFTGDDRINAHKIAAITYSVLTKYSADKFFTMNDELKDSSLYEVMWSNYIYRILVAILDIRVRDVPYHTERDMTYCIINGFDIELPWMFCTMDLFCSKYGSLRMGVED